jgi:subtilisin
MKTEIIQLKTKLITILLLLIMLSSLATTGIASSAPDEKARVIVGFKDLPDADLVQAHGGEKKYEYNSIHAIATTMPIQQIEALKKNPKVAYVEEDAVVQATEYNSGGMQDWGVIQIGAQVVHETSPNNKGTGVKVAVIDTGINYGHIDLKKNSIDLSGKQLGYNFLSLGLTPPIDDNGHGTHCAGIIAAEINSAAVVGVAPEAKIYALKVLNSAGSGLVSDIIAAIGWACDNGIQIISMSLGSSTSSQALQDACTDAFVNHNIVVVAAAGNNGAARTGTNILYPARCANVIAVGATDPNNARAYFSNTGPELDLMAPGVSILSDYLNQDTLFMSGTSMATPHVAGTAALILNSNEAAWEPYGYTNGNVTWESAEVTNVLIGTADDLGATGKDNLYGYGIVDADHAALTPPPPPVIAEQTYTPIAIAKTQGTITGSYTLLSASDDQDLAVKSAKVSTSQTIDWYSTTKINEAPSKVNSLTIIYEGSYTSSKSQTLYLYNFVTSKWQSIDAQTVSTTDKRITYTTNTPANFISASGEIQLRTYATQRTSTSFTCNADYTQISIKYTQ